MNPGLTALSCERLGRAAMHPLKIAVLEALERGEASPPKLADDLDQPIASVSYRVGPVELVIVLIPSDAGVAVRTRGHRSGASLDRHQ